MKNKIVFVLITFLLVGIFSVETVKANSFVPEVQYKLEEENCESVFGDPKTEGTTAHFLDGIFTTIKWVAPLLCLVFSVVEFVKAAASQDKDALNKAFSKTIKRIVLALILFFLPSLINVLFPLIGWYGTCDIGS